MHHIDQVTDVVAERSAQQVPAFQARVPGTSGDGRFFGAGDGLVGAGGLVGVGLVGGGTTTVRLGTGVGVRPGVGDGDRLGAGIGVTLVAPDGDAEALVSTAGALTVARVRVSPDPLLVVSGGSCGAFG